MGAIRMVPETVPLDVTTRIETEPKLGRVPALVVGIDMVTICSEGGSESDDELDDRGEESIWGIKGL